jgi:hypothetical protein
LHQVLPIPQRLVLASASWLSLLQHTSRHFKQQ